MSDELEDLRQERDRLQARNTELVEAGIASTAKIADFANWLKLSRRFAWAHERSCPRHDADLPCDCGLDAFICAPRPVIASELEAKDAEIAALKAECDRWESRAGQLAAAIDHVMIGGNHLASALIQWLGAGESTFPPYSTPHDKAGEIIADVNQYDAWVCWKSIMEARDGLQNETPASLLSQRASDANATPRATGNVDSED